MALLGAQMVITLVMVSIIQKLNPHFSFAKWLLCSTGLKRFLHPTNEQLKSLAGITNAKTKNKHNSKQDNSNFHLPRNLELELETSNISTYDVIHLRYFTEYQWLVDFSMYSAFVYIISEVYNFYFPFGDEINLSLIWCLLVVFFALKLLGSLTILYFHNEESIGERSMCTVACFFYMLLAMIVLTFDENVLETGLREAYVRFNESASSFLKEQGISSRGPASEIVLKFFICFFCGLLGSIYTFPGLRMAKMHSDSLRYCKERKFLQILLNTSFVLPLLMIILWIRPISRYNLTVKVFDGMETPLISHDVFESLRLFVIIFVVVLRFTLMPIYLQSYLNIAYDRIISLRKEAGRITNIDLQRKVSSIFYYLCVITLQFAAPLILCLYLTLMYKSLGGYSWIGSLVNTNSSQNNLPVYESNSQESEQMNILESNQNLQISWHSLKQVFSTEVWRGLLGFATWWSYFILFTSSSIGILYQSYFKA